MPKISARSFCAMGSLCLALAGCNGGSDTTPTSSAGSTSQGMGTNTAPTITGSPSASAVADTPYAYQPAAQDADGDSLQYSISGKPAWATFSVSTGLLTGVPAAAEAGIYEDIVIAVTDGVSTAALPAFSIIVAGTGATPAPTVLSWQMPEAQETAAGPAVAGYRIYHGLSADALTDVHQVAAADITRYEFEALPTGTHFFAVSTYTADGLESPLSAVVSKTIS